MRRLVLATHNLHKVREIREILGNLPYEILTAMDFPSVPEPEETGATLEENAILKARALCDSTGLWALADDSGLEIDYLEGAPGVMSARFAGPGCTFADNNAKVLGLLNGIPNSQRTARFRCVAALAMDGGKLEVFHGVTEGIITTVAGGEAGFGYDPIFYSPELARTFAEASADAKNRVSHRGRAFRQVAERLRGFTAVT
ncbi:MAG: XTP/dITP diphosphatase [candidate division Zixibacteria bacterium]|nr:XTP/dITP diphosphatase [candidate division Zixibacteria bacterium]